MKWLIFLLVWLAPLPGFCWEYELAACAIFQNEDRFLEEWITYHHYQGVEHFWLYNNNSSDKFRDILAPFIQSGLVELIEWPSSPHPREWENFSFNVQVKAYTDALNRARGKANWLAIIDTDEFILSLQSPLKDLLHLYEDEVALCLQWACFGTSHVEFCPSGSMLKQLVMRLPLDHPRNGWYKSIVKPLYIANCQNPHLCNLKVGQNRILPRSEARLNHYWTRDEAFLHQVKIPRYEKWGGKKEDLLRQAEEMNSEIDTEGFPF